LGQNTRDTEETHKTADSTFKPKSLRNRAKEKMDALVAVEKEMQEAEERKEKLNNYLEPGEVFSVRLKPTGVNENARRRNKSKFVNFQKSRRAFGKRSSDKVVVVQMNE
jgi:hypothetical protein